MKGLLLKDWYMMKMYCKSYHFIAVCFVALSLVSNGNMFFVFYPCLLCGMIPVNLLGYDERSRWMQYSGTMPYTKAQIVSGKYLIGLLAQLTILLVMGVAQAVKMVIADDFVLGEFAVLMLLMLIVSTLTSSIPLPFVFKLGVEKGRTAYYVMIGVICGGAAISGKFFGESLQATISFNTALIIGCVVAAAVFALSWYLSILFYRKRELH